MIVDAGHLPPYIDGREIELPACLPLGITADISPAVVSLQLEPGQTLTLVSDGVVEAQNKSGELFGFERTAAVSTRAAEDIARAARDFGQEDDITVLKLAFASAEILSRLSKLSFLFWGVQRGYFSFQRERGESMKADEL